MEDGLFGQLGVNARSLAGEDQKQDFEHARTLLLCMEVMRVKVEASNQRTATLLNVKVSTYILRTTLMYIYRKIPNVSPGLIEVFKHFLGGLYSGGLIFGGLIFGGHFVLVSEYQDLKNHCFI